MQLPFFSLSIILTPPFFKTGFIFLFFNNLDAVLYTGPPLNTPLIIITVVLACHGEMGPIILPP